MCLCIKPSKCFWLIFIFLGELAQQEKEKQLEKDIEKFREFEKQIEEGNNSNNPIHSTLTGNELLKKGNHVEAIKQYQKAEIQDSVFSVPAKYNTVKAQVDKNKEVILK